MMFPRATRLRTRAVRIGMLCAFLLTLGAVLVARMSVNGPDTVCGASCYSGVYARGGLPENYVALTFDDGPAGQATADILAVLAEHKTPATFFLTGEHIVAYPAQVKAIYDAGHIIGNHTYTHAQSVHENRETITRELHRTNTLIEALIGRSAILYRPPFLLDLGGFEVEPSPESKPVWSWVYDAGYIPIGVDLDTDDWVAESPGEVLEEAREALTKKKTNWYELEQHVLLFHDDPNTARALPHILALIEGEGLTVVPLTTLLAMNRDIVMPPTGSTSQSIAVAVVLLSSSGMLITILVLSLFMAVAALARMVGFLVFKSRQRKRAPVDARLLPRFAGTISVLIPAYNEAENIRATIRSVLANTRQPDEIIVIDDGSTDATLAYARSLEAEHPGRIRVITKENGGKASALNCGIAVATGDIVIAIDGDTVLHPSCIDAASRPFVYGRVGAVAGKILPARMETFIERYQYLEYVVGQNIDKEFISSLGSVHVVPGAVGAWRREALRGVGGYSADTLVEDQDLTLALLGKNYGIVYAPSAVAYTEVPTTLGALYLQRFRWTYGTFQCLFKYRRYLFSDEALRLGWISLPYSFTFNIVMPVVALALSLSVIIGVIVGVVHPGFLMLLVFTALDTLYAYVALLEEPKIQQWLALLVPFQRFAYLIAYSIIILLVLVKILDGSPTRWNKSARNGSAERFFRERLMGGIYMRS